MAADFRFAAVSDRCPVRHRPRVRLFPVPDGTVHLVADNLTPETARAVLLHEVFHAGGEALIGSRGWTMLLERVEAAVSAALRREEAGDSGDFWIAALAQARTAEVKPEHFNEEVAAYVVENHERAPAGMREVVERLIGRVKAWLLRTFGRQFGDVTPAQLRAIAVAALRSSADAGTVLRGDTKFSLTMSNFGREMRAFLMGRPVAVGSGSDVPALGKLANIADWAAKRYEAIRNRVSRADIGDVVLDRRAVKNSLSHGYGKNKVQALALLPTIIAEGRVAASGKFGDWGEAHVILAPVEIGGVKMVGAALVRKDMNGQSLYVHEAIVLERLLQSTINTSADASGVQRAGTDAGAIRKVILDALHVNESGDGIRYSMQSEPPAGGAKETLFGKAKQAASDFVTAAMVGTKSTPDSLGRYGALALVPTRPLFKELAKGMPSAGFYIDTKQAMDALRAHWHGVTHETLQKWQKFARKAKGENARLMDLMHAATLAQIDPSKALMQGDNLATYNDLKEKFDGLSPTAKALFAEVRDAYAKMADEGEREVLANIKRALDRVVRDAEKKHADEMERIRDDGLDGTERDEAVAAADKAFLIARSRGGYSIFHFGPRRTGSQVHHEEPRGEYLAFRDQEKVQENNQAAWCRTMKSLGFELGGISRNMKERLDPSVSVPIRDRLLGTSWAQHRNPSPIIKLTH